MSTINISKNTTQHSRTKHIDIGHQFLKEFVEGKVVTMDHVSNENQLAEIYTKALDVAHFKKLRSALGLCIIENL